MADMWAKSTEFKLKVSYSFVNTDREIAALGSKIERQNTKYQMFRWPQNGISWSTES